MSSLMHIEISPLLEVYRKEQNHLKRTKMENELEVHKQVPVQKFDRDGYPIIEFTEVASFKDLHDRASLLEPTNYLQTIVHDYDPILSPAILATTFKKVTRSKKRTGKFWILYYKIINTIRSYKNSFKYHKTAKQKPAKTTRPTKNYRNRGFEQKIEPNNSLNKFPRNS